MLNEIVTEKKDLEDWDVNGSKLAKSRKSRT
jgi:hypothetical protein